MNLLKYLFYWILGILSFLLFDILYFKKFEFDNKFNIADILNLFVTLAVGFFIGSILNKRISEKRIEKDFLIKKFDNISEPLDNIYPLLRASIGTPIGFGMLNITNNLHIFGSKINKIKNMSEISNLNIDIKPINEQISQLRRLLTLIPLNSSFRIDVINEYNNIYDLIELAIYRIIVKINKK